MAKEKEENVMYYGNGQGRWIKRVWEEPCGEEVFMLHGKCQGVKGHNGCHWQYEPDGSFAFHVNADDPTNYPGYEGADIACGKIPPDHKHYISPKKMTKKHYLNFYEDTDVTDPTEVARLEAGEVGPGEGIDRPLTEEEYRKFLEDEKK